MKTEVKRWMVEYDHKDGRNGKAEATTEIYKSGDFSYGNGMAGRINVNDDAWARNYDLRYEKGDLHRLMLADYFGNGLVNAIEIV